MAQVLALARRVEPHPRGELSVVGAHADFVRVPVLDSLDRVELAAGEAETLAALAVAVTVRGFRGERSAAMPVIA